MTLFELVKLALDDFYAEGHRALGDKVDDAIKARMEYLSKSYGHLDDPSRDPVNYKDPATRFAYVYKYVATHGDYIVQVLEHLQEAIGSPLFASEVLRLSCIGGGPGSDIIAILKFLSEHKSSEQVRKVTCYLLDREQAWADTWTELDESLKVGIGLNVNFQPLDVTKPESWEAQRKFLQADLFTMSFFVSEVMALDRHEIVSKFWTTLFNNAKPGALFLYTDNGHNTFNSYFDKLWKAAKLEQLIGSDNTRFTPRYSERANELSEYQKKFGQFPKLQGQVSYRVLRKPK